MSAVGVLMYRFAGPLHHPSSSFLSATIGIDQPISYIQETHIIKRNKQLQNNVTNPLEWYLI
jgi:hypothetical protein